MYEYPSNFSFLVAEIRKQGKQFLICELLSWPRYSSNVCRVVVCWISSVIRLSPTCTNVEENNNVQACSSPQPNELIVKSVVKIRSELDLSSLLLFHGWNGLQESSNRIFPIVTFSISIGICPELEKSNPWGENTCLGLGRKDAELKNLNLFISFRHIASAKDSFLSFFLSFENGAPSEERSVA